MDNRKKIEPSCQGMISFPRYNDFSRKDLEWVEQQLAHFQSKGNLLKQPRKRAKSTFPQCLYYMLDSVERDGKSNIVSFQPHGRSFKIHDRKMFASDILPYYFPHQTKISSFLRQLNIYGFLRMVKNGPDQDAYYNQLFLHGRPEMCCLIQRNPVALACARQTYNPSTEPDFYNMLPVMVIDPKLSSNSARTIDSEVIASTYQVDPNQSIDDAHMIGSITIPEDTRKIAPIQHFDSSDIEPMPLMEGLPGFNTFTTEHDLNYHPIHLRRHLESSSILDRNPSSYSFPSQVPQPMVATVPMHLSNDVTGNKIEMNCDDPHKIQSLLGLPNRTSPSCKPLNKMEVTRRLDEMPAIDTFSIGATHAPYMQNHFNVDMMSNSAEILSSIRIFDVNFVHEQHRQGQEQEQQNQTQHDHINTNSQSLNDHGEASRKALFLEDVDLESD